GFVSSFSATGTVICMATSTNPGTVTTSSPTAANGVMYSAVAAGSPINSTSTFTFVANSGLTQTNGSTTLNQLQVTGTTTFSGNVSTTIATSTFVGTNNLGILISASSTKGIVDPSPVAGDFFPIYYTDAPINIKQVDCANFPATVASGTTGNTFAF